MVLGVTIIIILLSSTWLIKKTGQNCLVMGFFVIPYAYLASSCNFPCEANYSQVFRRDHRLDERREQEYRDQSRLASQLLHCPLFLGRADRGDEYDLEEYWRPD